MYFPSEDERRLLVGRLLPQARREGVHEELRGWSWREPPLSPAYDVRLGAAEIAGKYCGTSRDVYARRVLGLRASPNRAMREGAALHRALADVVLRAKRLIYTHGAAECVGALAELAGPGADVVGESGLVGAEAEDLSRKVATLRGYEYHRIVGRVQEVLARQPRVGTDSLATLALPVTLEQQLDGTLLGLSGHLSVDALTVFEPVVFDVKFGRREEFHRLSTTAYALVLESLHEQPVDVGCVVYGRFEGSRLLVERDPHLIDDELRQWFVDERDERMRMVSEELDPGVPERCYEDCPYQGQCRRA